MVASVVQSFSYMLVSLVYMYVMWGGCYTRTNVLNYVVLYGYGPWEHGNELSQDESLSFPGHDVSAKQNDTTT